NMYVGHCSRQGSDLGEESQVCRGWVDRVTAVVRVCDFKIPKRKETGREEMERLRHGNGATRSFLGALADLKGGHEFAEERANGGVVDGRVSNDVPGPEGVEKRLVGSNDFFEALEVEWPVPVKGLVPGEEEDAKTIGDVGRAPPKM